MAFMDKSSNRNSTERNGSVPGERQRPVDGLVALLCVSCWATVLLAPGVDALDNEFVNRMEMATLDLFLNQSLCFGLEVDSHCRPLPRATRGRQLYDPMRGLESHSHLTCVTVYR